MSDFQYARTETFARKRHCKKRMHQFNILTALFEVLRRENYCRHVLSPLLPKIVLGGYKNVLRAVARWYRDTRDSRGRRLQRTTNAMVGAVFSYPRERFEADPVAYAVWCERLMQWLQKKYGERLRMLVEHLDESHPHFHAMLVPLPGESIASVHPGAAVWAEIGQERQHRGKGRKAIEAQGFVNWQDEYFAEVAEPCGFLRCKEPDQQGKHLSRKEYNARQLEQARIAALLQPAPQPLPSDSIAAALTSTVAESQQAGQEEVRPVDATSEAMPASGAIVDSSSATAAFFELMQRKQCEHTQQSVRQALPDARPAAREANGRSAIPCTLDEVPDISWRRP